MNYKYYTPTLSEIYSHPRLILADDNRAGNVIVNPYAYLDENKLSINLSDLININKYVVKYLDSEDIESLGFKKSNKNSWIGYKDYFLDSINPEYPYFLFATIHIPVRDDMYKILVHRYYCEDEPIEDDAYGEPTCVYIGKIKNKYELNQLLKRLNIINE